MNVYALFDNVSYEKIDMTLLRPGNKTNVVEITYLSSVPDNIRESFDIGIKEAYLLLAEHSNQIPEKISVWYRGFDKNSRGNSTDLAFALALTAYFVNNGSLKIPDGIDMISATGIIRKDGGINKVIGLKNKILAAVDINGAQEKHLLFYPEENREELELLRKEDIEFDTKIIESGVKLIPVKTLRDAFESMGFTNNLKSEPVVIKNKKALVIAGSALLICVSAVLLMSIFNGNKEIPSAIVIPNPVTSAPDVHNAVDTSDAVNKRTPTPTFTQQNKNTPIITTGSATAPKAAPEKPAATIAVKAVPPSIKLNDDNSITITFWEPVKNTLATDGALNTENYKLLDGNSRPVSENDGGIPEIWAIKPGSTYKLVFLKLKSVNSSNFILKVSNIGSDSTGEKLVDKVSLPFKTNDTKSPYICVGPKAYYKSGWIVRLVFDEEMDRASAEKLGEYMLEDFSAKEKYYLSELDDVEIRLLNDRKTVEISLPDVEPGKDYLKVFFVKDNSKQKNMLDKDYLDVPMIISN